MSVVSNNLKKVRKHMNWSQEQAAKALGIKRATLGSYEEGRALPKITLLPGLLSVYGIRDWQAFLNDPHFDINNQSTPPPPPTLIQSRYDALDEKHKSLVNSLLNLP